ncbi:MAG: hypothetical protein M1819_001114 [Sarea resinae]|nr:MAG: hypothetical protein M1819_001114 [Sarea resinae]
MNGAVGSSDSNDGSNLRPRAYQLEMFEESKRRNIIVAMDTGSGKTQIAVMRIGAELEICSPEKLVWFLAPTVSLCQQQYEVISTLLPAFQCRFLSGIDNVEYWGEQHIWDAALTNVRIVVSTHQILFDALTHGFVSMNNLALIVFDEAHHCTQSHAANRIMRHFYHPLLEQEDASIPHILGLTACPNTTGKVDGLQIVEQNLDAVSKTPKLHRQELLQYVHPPELRQVVYPPPEMEDPKSLRVLRTLYENLDIRKDPYVVALSLSQDTNDQRQLKRTLLNKKTYCQDQLRKFLQKAEHIHEELGAWATSFYISSCIAKFTAAVRANTQLQLECNDEEIDYLYKKLTGTETQIFCPELSASSTQISPKVECFIDVLVEESSLSFTGLAFVQQRATVAVLSHLLSVHPRTKHLLKCGTFVGASGNPRRKDSIGDLVDITGQWDSLKQLKESKKNLVIGTSVLEEGIDISACHIVICFSKPPNLRSFIQRRGRARKAKSKYVLMFGGDEHSATTDKYSQLEQEMKGAYEDDMRLVQNLRAREDINEADGYQYRVESTGALLILDSAKHHLYHFCATVSTKKYVDVRPEFFISEDASTGRLSASVLLPSSVDSSLRTAHGSSSWNTEKMAKKDACFQAYVALHKGGLVNDNLLPVLSDEEEDPDESFLSKIPAIVAVSELFNPWIGVAEKMQHADTLYSSTVQGMAFPLYWTENETYEVTISTSKTACYTIKDLPTVSSVTHLLLFSVFRSRIKEIRLDFPAFFCPNLKPQLLDAWYSSMAGTRAATDIFSLGVGNIEVGLIRDISDHGKVHIFKSLTKGAFIACQSEGDVSSTEEVFIEASKFPKRRDFLHPAVEVLRSTSDAPKSTAYLPADRYVVEALIGAAYLDGGMNRALSCLRTFLPELPWLSLSNRHASLYGRIALTVPLPPHFLELEELIGYKFNKKLLLIEAMTHPSFQGETAREPYQRLEFLGDAVLDNIVVSNIFEQKEISHQDMHLMRTVLVNADFLTFLCLEWSIGQERFDIIGDPKTKTFHEIETSVSHQFWKFMRHGSRNIAQLQQDCMRLHVGLRDRILDALLRGTKYPWTLLAALDGERYKFFSDIIESLLGAVYVDSKGDMAVCALVAEKIGILRYLRRILAEDIRLLHPKEELGRVAVNAKVRYLWESQEDEEEKEEEETRQEQEKEATKGDGYGEGEEKKEKQVWCVVEVGNRRIVRVQRTGNKIEAETRAAEQAIDILTREKEEMMGAGKRDEIEDDGHGGVSKDDGECEPEAHGEHMGNIEEGADEDDMSEDERDGAGKKTQSGRDERESEAGENEPSRPCSLM